MGIQISYEDATELIRLFAGRSDPEKNKKQKQKQKKKTLCYFYQFGSFKNSIKCYTDMVGKV